MMCYLLMFVQVVQNEDTSTVKVRKKRTNLNNYKPGDHPIRPPRSKEYTFSNCRIAESQKQRFKPTRPHSIDLSESYHFKDSALTHNRSKDQISPSQGLVRTYHSTQNLSEEHQHRRQHNPTSENSKYPLFPSLRYERNHHSTQNLSGEHIKHHQSRESSNSHHGHDNEKSMGSKNKFDNFPSLNLGRNYHSTQNLSGRSSHYNVIERPRSANFSLEEPIKVKANYRLVQSHKTHMQQQHVKNVTKDSTKHYQSTGNIYKSVTKESSSHDKHEPHHLSVGDVSQWSSGSHQRSLGRERKGSGQLIFSSEKPKTRIGGEFSKNSSCETRVIPIEIYSNSAPMSPLGSPSTKYKTRVVVYGAA